MRFASAVLGRILGQACFMKSECGCVVAAEGRVARAEESWHHGRIARWEDPVSNFSTEERPIGHRTAYQLQNSSPFLSAAAASLSPAVRKPWQLDAQCELLHLSATPIRRYEYASSFPTPRLRDHPTRSASRSCCCELRLLLPEAPGCGAATKACRSTTKAPRTRRMRTMTTKRMRRTTRMMRIRQIGCSLGCHSRRGRPMAAPWADGSMGPRQDTTTCRQRHNASAHGNSVGAFSMQPNADVMAADRKILRHNSWRLRHCCCCCCCSGQIG